MLKTLALLLLLSLSSSCSSFNCTRLEKHLGADANLISLSHKIADNLVSQAMPPLIARQADLPVITTTFVNNNKLEETSHFGRIIQEHITSRLVQLGYAVNELRLRNNMLIQAGSGETMLSRELKNISAKQKSQAIIVGTYSYTQRTMYISTRLINSTNHNIIATYDYKLCMDDNVLAMFGLMRTEPESHTIDEPRQPTQVPFL